jgi:uncharacterized protein
MSQLELSPQQARRIALHAQLLDGRARLARGAEGAHEVIERLGYVQLDTIAVVERAHHHTLWTRLPDYAPPLLDELFSSRRVFEYWGHAASILPLSDYRYYLPAMRRHREQPSAWAREMIGQGSGLAAEVLRRIRDEGPLRSSHFESAREGGGGWWGWKPTKAALELLFWQGELMISAREGFQRVYDLAQRVLPPGTDTREPDADELGRFSVRRALQAHGVARERDICGHLSAAPKPVEQAALRELLAAGEVAELRVAGQEWLYYALAAGLDALLKLRSVKPRLHILSPFDNLLIQRDRLLRLFNYDYTIECYTPAPKRKYGYFSLPILWGEQFAGRLDAKAERKAQVLCVRGLWLEEGFSAGEEFCSALAAKLREYARFNGCEEVRIEAVAPKTLVAELHKQLRAD